MLASYGGVHGFYSPSRPCRPGVDADGWDYSISWSSRTDWYPKSSKRTHVRRRRWVRPKSVVSLKGNPRVDQSKDTSLSLSLSLSHTHTHTTYHMVSCCVQDDLRSSITQMSFGASSVCSLTSVWNTRRSSHLMKICFLFSFFLSLFVSLCIPFAWHHH